MPENGPREEAGDLGPSAGPWPASGFDDGVEVIEDVGARRRGPADTVLGAAMIGLGRVLEPQYLEEPAVAVASAPDDEPELDLRFGRLPPLD